jgi:DNA mismatch repair ATPase MutS
MFCNIIQPQKDDYNKIEFQLPIYYLENKYKLNNHIKSDLELLDISNNSLYNNIVSDVSNNSTRLINKWCEYYTTNLNFLKDYQDFFKKYIPVSNYDVNNVIAVENILDEMNEMNDINEMNEMCHADEFHYTYGYIDIEYFKSLNKIPLILQILTVYNLSSPVISLAAPIFMLIMPFFILKIKGLHISLNTYIETIIKLFQNHIIGQVFSKISNGDISQQIISLFSLGIYVYNVYLNIKSCRTFYKNIYKIQNILLNINNFITFSINNINNISKYSKTSFIRFLESNNKIKTELILIKTELDKINLHKINLRHITKIGNILKCFYELNTNIKYREILEYCIDLHYYLLNIKNIQKHIITSKINYCRFSKKITCFTDAYFASLINNNPVKNSYNFNKQIVITGPNAAGKTTILKSALFNIILSQQLGVGCYKKAVINPYNYIYSYINIPDTSQRDSLFQAEARRCKEILDNITNNLETDRHFCIFDEIYSGTNPSEAIASAYSYLKHLSTYDNINFALTTHYITLCKLLDSNNKITNKHMQVININNTYKLNEGISNIKGGIRVLQELGYNKSIIMNATNILKQIDI